MKILLFIPLFIFITSCKKSGIPYFTNEMMLSPKSEINLDEVSDHECLDIQKYIAAINQLYPEPLIRVTTADMIIIAGDSPTHNFAVKTAYQNFIFKDLNRKSIPELMSLEQNACATVTIKTIGGDSEDYKVIEYEKNKLHIESDSGESYSFEWISPQHFKTTHGYKSSDFLCNTDLNDVIRVEKDYSWEPDYINSDKIPSDLISSTYLQLVAEASGSTIDINIPLTVGALTQLGQQPIKSDFLNCTNP